MLEMHARKGLEKIKLSNNTIHVSIQYLLDDAEQLLAQQKPCNGVFVEIDESTDVSGFTLLLVFIRYSYQNTTEEK
jgi:hypothetical protein